jgi:nanoRNase/pAp phosphatase (c-di-AMP/oligoRNAs hydrolase)
MNMIKNNLDKFLKLLTPLQRVVIQAHDFPDHDAISSAYGLSIILQSLGMNTIIVYNGSIDRISLSNMIEWLDIPIIHCSKANLNAHDKIITVDGCIGEKNVTDIQGEEVAVIDHHTVIPPKHLWYCDIRENYGATATIIYEYFKLLGVKIPQDVATSLLVGLNIDTANLTRGFCNADLKAFLGLNQIADLALVNKVCRNSLEQGELVSFQQAFDNVKSDNGVAIVLLKEPCAKNLLGVLADFLLSVNEYDIVIVAMKYNQAIQLSLRSECPKVNVGQLLRHALNKKQRGFGGGHAHMAGGMILKDESHHFITSSDAHFKPFTDAIALLRANEKKESPEQAIVIC